MQSVYASRGSVFALAAAVGAVALLVYLAWPSTNAGYSETVTIATDDPQVTVTAISQYGKPVAAVGLNSSQARFAILSDEDGIPCDSDELEVRTSNNVVHYPRLNLCEARWRIQLATAIAPLPLTLKPEPSLKWINASLNDAGQPLEALHYGVPETDATLMTATCQAGAGRITAKFSGDPPNAPTARIDFYAPGVLLRYDATVDKPEEAGAEEVMPFVIEQAAANPFWTALASGAAVPFRIGTSEALILDATTGAPQIFAFVKACNAR